MHRITTRRSFMRAAAIVGAIAASLPGLLSVARASVKPDILMIMPDQMRGDCLSILGHPGVETPQLDRLANEGVLFRRAYTTASSCIPARYALLSGLHPQSSGVVGYRGKVLSTRPFPELLGNAGYITALVGRNMHQVRASGTCGYQKNILRWPEYNAFLKKAAPGLKGGLGMLIKYLGLSPNHWEAKPWPLGDELHPTEWTVKRSLELLESAAPDKPLFLTTSLLAPHPPLFPPKTYFDRCRNKDLPEIARGDWVQWNTLPKTKKGPGQRVLLEGDVLRSAQAGYFGLIEHIDAQVESLIREFKERSKKNGRPWVIVVTSDHGEMLGDHGYFRKCEPYEGSANIPLIVSGSPDLKFRTGARSNDPVCLEDIMPTLLTLAGAETPGHVDGVSLLPALHGQKKSVRKWLHFEHATCYGKDQGYHALTDGQLKYIWRPMSGREQLFDLTNDPQEKRDLSNRVAHSATLDVWRKRLVQRLANRPEGFSKDGRLIAGRPYPPQNRGTLNTNKNVP